MAPQQAYAQEPDTPPALWLDYEFATFEVDQDFSPFSSGGIYIFAECLGPEWGVLPNGRLYCDGAGKLTVTSRKIGQFGETQDRERPLWWPIYVAQADHLGEALTRNKYMDEAVNKLRMTHVHLLQEPDAGRRDRCVKELIEKFNPAINQLLRHRREGQ